MVFVIYGVRHSLMEFVINVNLINGWHKWMALMTALKDGIIGWHYWMALMDGINEWH